MPEATLTKSPLTNSAEHLALPVAAMNALQLYVRYRAESRTVEALRAASEACHEAPHAPQCHYAYGEAWLAIGQHANAARAFAEVLRLAPTWPDAWINLGLARYRLGGLDEATHAMRRALECRPGDPVATSNLAAFLRLSGELDESEALLRGLLARKPYDYGARLNLAAELLLEERASEAFELLDSSLPEQPAARRHWLLQRSLALLQLGRLEEARADIEQIGSQEHIPAEVAPLWHWRWVLFEQARGHHAAAAERARVMQTSLSQMGPDATPEHRIMGHFDLAKFWSGRAEHATAFHCWQQAHSLLKLLQPFNRDEHRALIDANIASFDAASLKAGASNSDRAPVFIVGMPRSGTTLCEQILAAHHEVHGSGERAALGRLFQSLGGGFSAEAARRIAAMPREALNAPAARYLAELHALAPTKRRIVDKMPANYLYLGLAARLLPGARFIHCVRDARDIGVSIFTFRFHGAHGYAHDLADLGWTVGQQQRLMIHWKTVLPRGRVLTVALENWVQDFDATLASVLQHVGLAHDPACERFYEQEGRVRTVSRAQVRQPVNARGLGRWRNYADQIAPMVSELERAGCLPGAAVRRAARRKPKPTLKTTLSVDEP